MYSSPIKAILVDDEISARNVLSKLLEIHCPHVTVLAQCENVEKAVDAIRTHTPDIVFLDIEMPNYAGYEIVSFFKEINFGIIFVTAYDQYAIKAFELSAIDYLLKPVDIDRLKVSVARFAERREISELKKTYQTLSDNLKEKQLTKIIIPHNGRQKVILLRNIIAFEASEAYVIVHLDDRERFIVSKNLKHFENMLSSHPDFFRSHKSWLINIKALESYDRKTLQCLMKGGLSCKLSKYKKSDFEEKIRE